MGVRPPQQDSDEPDVIEFGIAALAARLDDGGVTFPATGEEIVDQLGDPKVPFDAHGNTVALSTILEEVPARRFETQQEFLNTVHPVFESYRADASAGIIASIRSFLPF